MIVAAHAIQESHEESARIGLTLLVSSRWLPR
jgi:hypothetical protein